MANKEIKTTGRLRSIDGMRGLAAMAVVLFHLSGKMIEELQAVLPGFITMVMSYGYLGVPVFFVISGIVISLSVSNQKVTLRYAGNFALRRSIRLDITYWASIFFVLALMTLNNNFLGGDNPYPSMGNVLLHMFYLQGLFEVDPVISVVYWTLCLEIQLYLFFLASVWLSQTLSKRLNFDYYKVHLSGVVLLGIYSLTLDQQITSLSVAGLFVPYWHYFLIGMLISNVIRGEKASIPILFSWMAIEIGFLMSGEIVSYSVAGIGFGVLVFFLWRWNLMDTFLSSRFFQYLGSISYTLYLVHPDVGWKAISVGKQVFGSEMSSIATLFVFLSALLLSILIAHLFHVVFEKPSLWLCKQLKSMSLKELLAMHVGERLSRRSVPFRWRSDP
ncbi:acyltransferase family protein [Pseudomonadota bacterium]